MTASLDKFEGHSERKLDFLDFLTAKDIDHSCEGDLGIKVSGISSLADAKETDLAFCSLPGDQAASLIEKSNAGILLCNKELRGKVKPARTNQLIVFLDNPRRTFVMFAGPLQDMLEAKSNEGHPRVALTSVVSNSANVGLNCTIGAYSIIGANSVIGDNTKIHDRVVLRRNCQIGRNCVIQSGVTLGEDGFAYERHENIELSKFPHFRGVIIGDNVEICSNTNIARGSLVDTVIGNGTKIDAMVHIAHNVKVGRNCQLTAGTVIGGSAIIGDNCWTGLNSTIKDHVRLGDNVIVGAGACVIRDVPDGDIVAGVPAKSIKQKASGTNIFLMAGQKISPGN